MTKEEFDGLEIGDAITFNDDIYENKQESIRIVVEKTSDSFVASHPVNGHNCTYTGNFGPSARSFVLENYELLEIKVKDTRLARKMYPNHEVLDNGMLKIKKELV